MSLVSLIGRKLNLLHIGLDFVNLASLKDGLGRFSRLLVSGIDSCDSEHRYTIFANEKISRNFDSLSSRFSVISV